MVTNGFLLDKKHIDIFRKFPLNEVQVTLDGTKARHDQMRHLKHNKISTYDKIIGNIDYFLNTFPETKLSVRINLDKSNHKSYFTQRTELAQCFEGKNISIYPGILRIENSDGKCMGCESLVHDDIRELFYEMEGYVNFYPSLKSKGCCATHINSFVIGPKGEIFKCWNDVSDENKIVGYINKKDFTRPDLFNRYVLSTSCFRIPECRECFYLPICVGGCAHYRLKNLYEGGNFNLCSLYKKDGVLEKCLEIHYNKTLIADEF
ncbi:MAG: SPASM domain-containing protein [Chloroflexia bacterium]|nr:SPASM domain-containing protein [Bacteroidales bacterium]NJO90371.1 SPASM domain-containing protein [Chloroflexia bacterium]